MIFSDVIIKEILPLRRAYKAEPVKLVKNVRADKPNNKL